MPPVSPSVRKSNQNVRISQEKQKAPPRQSTELSRRSGGKPTDAIPEAANDDEISNNNNSKLELNKSQL